MCNIEIIEKEETRSPKENVRKRRPILKAIAGWISYLMGNGALFLAILNPFGFEPVSFIFGLIILTTSVTLLHQYTKGKPLEGSARISRYFIFTGMFILIPSFVINRVIKTDNPNHDYFSYLIIVGFLLVFSGAFIIKKIMK